jgi:hypothetical protein
MLRDVYTTNKKVTLDDLTSEGLLFTIMYYGSQPARCPTNHMDGGKRKAPKGLLNKGMSAKGGSN